MSLPTKRSQPSDWVQYGCELTEASLAAILDASAAPKLHRRLLRRLLRDVANFFVGPARHQPCYTPDFGSPAPDLR